MNAAEYRSKIINSKNLAELGSVSAPMVFSEMNDEINNQEFEELADLWELKERELKS